MKIELKKISVNLKFSEETTQFKADIYINDFKAGYAYNDGQGGSTTYFAYEGQQSLIKAAEGYCNSLPPMAFSNANRTYEIPMNFEYYIDKLLEQHLNSKERERHNKKLNADMLKGVVFSKSNPDEYYITKWKNNTISTLLQTISGRESLKQQIRKLKSEGHTILNTNIPKDLL